MMRQRRFALQDQFAFAKVSGDHNPLHVDPIAARRYMFGQPVVHGVHALLWALDTWCEEHDAPLHLRTVRATFTKPIALAESVRCSTVSEQFDHLEIEVLSGRMVSTRIAVDLEETTRDHLAQPGHHATIDAFPPNRPPRVLLLDELEGISESLELYLPQEETARLFPHLSNAVTAFQIAVLLSATRLVGAECPGLHSLFSSLELSFLDGRQQRPVINYSVSKVDRRFGLIHLTLDGECIKGAIRAFLRPSPVEQPSYASLRAGLESAEFAGQAALIIGGSRGLGEVAAKLLAAGGATVRITYYQGEQDARRIVEEIGANGGHADLAQFNILASHQTPSANSTDGWVPSHCYYFATPFIFSGVKGLFSADLFSRFCAYYVAGFVDTVDYWRGLGVTNFFYPSTVAIDELPLNMVEYTAAKAAGEKVCEFLETRHRELTIFRPRLPRAATDQTVSVRPVENRDPVALMLNNLRAFRTVAAKKH